MGYLCATFRIAHGGQFRQEQSVAINLLDLPERLVLLAASADDQRD
jgi:hypothetical protein